MPRPSERVNSTTGSAREPRAPLFVEVQSFRQVWLWVLLALIVLMELALLVTRAPLSVSIAGALGAALTLGFLYLLRLHVEVDEEGIVIRFRGLFVNRRIRLDEIAAFGARTYRPIREYGGWGVRGFSSNRAYNVSGEQGVQLVLTDGKRVLIGSQRAGELARALAEASDREASIC